MTRPMQEEAQIASNTDKVESLLGVDGNYYTKYKLFHMDL